MREGHGQDLGHLGDLVHRVGVGLCCGHEINNNRYIITVADGIVVVYCCVRF